MHRLARRFVLRAPVLPFAALDGLDLDRLHMLVADPAIAEAIFLASPELSRAAGDGVERALFRYISRMAGRATPFGLFSGVAVGDWGEATRLAIGTRHRRHTRLATEYLAPMCATLALQLRAELAFVPNSSVYRVGERLRYVEARLDASGRTHHLVAIDASSYVLAVLARAAGGATLAQLADVLAGDPELTRDEIDEFLETLVIEQVLQPVLQPPVTGGDPLAQIAEMLRPLPSGRGAAEILDEARANIAAIDAAGTATPAAYHAIAEALRALPGDATPQFQVDLHLDATVALGPRVAAEIVRSVELFRRLLPPPIDSWAPFRERFVARYDKRAVPLVEMLDEESGIGFGPRPDEAAQAPLLDDVPFSARAEPEKVAWTARHDHLLRLVTLAPRDQLEIELTAADLAILAGPLPPSIDTFTASVRLVARSPEAADAGDLRVWVHEVTDGSATRMLGRFCDGSPEIDALTRELARAEERLAPDARFAEIAHLPEGRAGNILIRPVLRGHEIAYLGASGTARDLQIPITDLVVSIEGTRVVIRSTRLGVEIRPAIAAAHNYLAPKNLAIYRFLAAHSTQGAHGGGWSWGPLEAAPFLPRLRHGTTIVARARWLLGRDELAGLTPDRLATLRERRHLPRWLALSDGNNELPVDLDNALAVASVVAQLRDRPTAVAYEWFDPIGAHVHDLLVPFVADRAPDPPVARVALPVATRRFLPGSRWLYAKLYGGTTDTEDALRQLVAPFVREVRAEGLADQFYFVRYADPEPHLRLRFAGDPARLGAELLPRLAARLEVAFDRNQAWRLQLETYERELERYGEIELAERVFVADSDAVLDVVEETPGADGRDARWQLALYGIDRLLGDLGLDLVMRRALVTQLRDRFGAEHGMDVALQRRLGVKYRTHADEIASLLAAGDEHPFAPALAAFARRSDALAGIAAASTEVASSHVHMHVNRMLPVAARRQELVLYDLLRRHYARATYRSPTRTAST